VNKLFCVGIVILLITTVLLAGCVDETKLDMATKFCPAYFNAGDSMDLELYCPNSDTNTARHFVCSYQTNNCYYVDNSSGGINNGG